MYIAQHNMETRLKSKDVWNYTLSKLEKKEENSKFIQPTVIISLTKLKHRTENKSACALSMLYKPTLQNSKNVIFY